MPPKPNKGNAAGKKKKKKNDFEGDRKKTEWDDLSTDALAETVKAMQHKFSEIQTRRIYAQADFETVQQLYNESLKLNEEADFSIQQKGADLTQLHDQCEMEIRTYRDKATFLQHIFDVTLQELNEKGAIAIAQLEQEMDVHLSDLLEQKRLLGIDIKKRDEDREADFNKFKVRIEQEFEICQLQLSNEAETLKQELLRRKNEKNNYLLQQQVEDKNGVSELKDLFMKKISLEHDDCKQRMMSYYDKVVQEQKFKISKLRARVATLQRERDDDIKMAQKLAAETRALEMPLSDIQAEFESLKVRQKKRDHDIKSLSDTKKRIAITREKITSLEKDCFELQQTLSEVQLEHDHLIRTFDVTVVKANQASISKAGILADKIQALTRAVDADEEQLRRILKVASLPKGEHEVIMAKLHSVLDQHNKNINQHNLELAKVNKDNAELLTKCQVQLCETGYSKEDVSKMLEVASINECIA